MTTHPSRADPGATSPPELLILHSLRLMGWPAAQAIAERTGLEPSLVLETLEDEEARGFTRRTSFGGRSGWSLTERGLVEDERRLAEELARTRTGRAVADAHERFAELNPRFLAACMRWQIRPAPGEPLAANDHTDWRWDDSVLEELRRLEGRLADVCVQLRVLRRFDGYLTRFAVARARVDAGERSWVDRPDADSCHLVWIQLHEDLLSTLGLHRGDGPAG